LDENVLFSSLTENVQVVHVAGKRRHAQRAQFHFYDSQLPSNRAGAIISIISSIQC